MNRMELLVPLLKNPTATSQEKGINWRARRVFTKPEIANQKREYKLTIIAALKRAGVQYITPFEGPVRLKLGWCFSTKEKKKWSFYKDTKPDLDNAAKLLVDVLADLGFFKVGDQQIAELHLYKCWQEKPSVKIEIESLVYGV